MFSTNGLQAHLLAVLLGVLLFFGSASQAADAAASPEPSKEVEKPFMNANFHDTYMPKDEAFITPTSHPYLFSFTGRWIRRRNVFQASTWPGTSVTALIYGQTCRVKIKSPVKTGIVEGHYFLASVDNGPQLFLTLPTYNATENPEFELNIKLPELDESIEKGSKTNKVLIPHVIEFTSEPAFPLKLIGITMDNMIIRQGRSWLHNQNSIPTVEYISDKLPESPVLNQTSIYQASRQLGLRQDYIVDYNTCFSGECSRKRAGLSEEYNYFSPFSGNPHPQDAREEMPNKYVFHRDEPMMMVKEPDFVIVDVGDNDLAKDVDGLEFMASLQHFFGNLILNARPEAEIFVLIRTGRYVSETEDAIVSMRYPKLHAVKFGTDTPEWYKSFYCSYIIPLGANNYPYRELCGTAYEQLAAGSGIEASSVLKGLLLVLFLGGALLSLLIKRRAIGLYIREIRGYGKLPQTE